MKLFNNISSVERKLNDLSPEEYYEKRLNLVRPKVEDLKSWLESEDAKVSGKFYLKTAFRYSLNCWKNLTVFLDDGKLDMTNKPSVSKARSTYNMSAPGFIIDSSVYLYYL